METEALDKRPVYDVFEFGDFKASVNTFADSRNNSMIESEDHRMHVSKINSRVQNVGKNIINKDDDILELNQKIDKILKSNFDLKDQLELIQHEKGKISEVFILKNKFIYSKLQITQFWIYQLFGYTVPLLILLSPFYIFVFLFIQVLI